MAFIIIIVWAAADEIAKLLHLRAAAVIRRQGPVFSVFCPPHDTRWRHCVHCFLAPVSGATDRLLLAKFAWQSCNAK